MIDDTSPMDCLFCQIVADTEEVSIVYEDGQVLARYVASIHPGTGP